ncbi:hypothetical protein P3W45_000359 [Vairimorpha bombi]
MLILLLSLRILSTNPDNTSQNMPVLDDNIKLNNIYSDNDNRTNSTGNKQFLIKSEKSTIFENNSSLDHNINVEDHRRLNESLYYNMSKEDHNINVEDHRRLNESLTLAEDNKKFGKFMLKDRIDLMNLAHIIERVIEYEIKSFNDSKPDECPTLAEYIRKNMNSEDMNDNLSSYREIFDDESLDSSIASQVSLEPDKIRIIEEIISSPFISNNLQECEDQLFNNYIYSIVSYNKSSFNDSENFNILIDDSENFNLLIDDSEDFTSYEPPQKIKRSESLEKDVKNFDNLKFYNYIIDKFNNYKYEYDSQKNAYFFELISNSIIKKYRSIFHKIIWVLYEFLYCLLKNNYKSKKSILAQYEMDTTLGLYTGECFVKLINLVDYIHKENIEGSLCNDKNLIELDSFSTKIFSIPDTKTFVNLDMPNKVNFLIAFNKSTFSIEESKIDYFNKIKRFIGRKLEAIDGRSDKLILQISFLHILSMKYSISTIKKLNNLLFIWKIYFEDPNTTNSLNIKNFNDCLVLVYDIPKWLSKKKDYFCCYNFVSILNKINKETNESELYTSLILVILPIFLNDKEIIIILSNKDEIYKFIDNNPDILLIIKNFIFALIKLTQKIN